MKRYQRLGVEEHMLDKGYFEGQVRDTKTPTPSSRPDLVPFKAYNLPYLASLTVIDFYLKSNDIDAKKYAVIGADGAVEYCFGVWRKSTLNHKGVVSDLTPKGGYFKSRVPRFVGCCFCG